MSDIKVKYTVTYIDEWNPAMESMSKLANALKNSGKLSGETEQRFTELMTELHVLSQETAVEEL